LFQNNAKRAGDEARTQGEMMENQHRLIAGYRELSADEIALMNKIKELGAALGALHDSIAARLQDEFRDLVTEGATDDAEYDAVNAALDAAGNAKLNLQTGIMWLTRAVARPKGF
jgi:hypothetical protein